MIKKQESQEDIVKRQTVSAIARNISELAQSVQSLLTGPLKKKTIVTLLSHSAGLSRHDTERVLTALEDLEKDWLN